MIMALNVHYGFAKLNKIRKKRALTVMFENDSLTERSEKFMKKMMHVVCSRKQSKEEMADGKLQNRVFTSYESFIDEKPFNGSIEHVLKHNYEADSQHASIEIRNEIKEKLRSAYRTVYNELF